jgi:excisionase family DNA binding protein
MSPALSLTLPPEVIEQIAQLAAEIVAESADEPERWIGVAEAAEHLACPASRIYALVSKRAIPFEKDGSRLLFKRSALDEWVGAGGATRP